MPQQFSTQICCFVVEEIYEEAFASYPLLLYVDHSIMDCNKDMLRIHVFHEATGCENLQYTLYRREKILHAGSGLEGLSKYIPGNSPLQLARYIVIPIFWHSMHICDRIFTVSIWHDSWRYPTGVKTKPIQPSSPVWITELPQHPQKWHCCSLSTRPGLHPQPSLH